MSEILLSIVIPVRGKANELWFTLQGLLHAGFQDRVEILVVDNDPSQEVQEVCDYFARPILRYIKAGEIKGVNYPRSVGANVARGKWLMMLDSHVLMQPGSYNTILERIRTDCYPPRSLVHCGVSFGAPKVWGSYRLTLETNFWGRWHYLVRPDALQPYPIAATGNWAFITRLEDWDSCGGFNEAFRGYGGDEIYLQLKYWRAGGQVLLDPLLKGCHWSGPRSYSVASKELIVNTSIAGRIVVGSDFASRFQENIVTSYEQRGIDAAVAREAVALGISLAERSSEISRVEQWPLSFDEILAYWQQSGIET
jgi:glycosyltransferase involved in cell wall biosynthesis